MTSTPRRLIYDWCYWCLKEIKGKPVTVGLESSKELRDFFDESLFCCGDHKREAIEDHLAFGWKDPED